MAPVAFLLLTSGVAALTHVAFAHVEHLDRVVHDPVHDQLRRLARKCCLGGAIIVDEHRMNILIGIQISWPLNHIAGSKITMEERGL